MNADQMAALLARAEPRLRAAWALLLSRLRESMGEERLAQLIAHGGPEEALREVQRLAPAFAVEVQAVYILAAQSAAAAAASSGVVVALDLTNTAAVRAMQLNQLRLIREITEQQRLVFHEVIGSGVTRGANPRAVARELRASLGLTQRQAQAVSNYRRLLQQGDSAALQRALRDRRFDASVGRAIDGTKPLTPDQVDRMVDRYRERYVAYRAEVIARTEALRAVHEGADETWRQLIEGGEVDRRRVVRTWVTARDGRVRDSHRPMNGQKRGMGEQFVSGRGMHLRHPGDIEAAASETIQCRCVVTIRILPALQVQP